MVEVTGWVVGAGTNGKRTTEIAEHFGLTTRAAYEIASEAESLGLLVGGVILRRDGSMFARSEARTAGVGVGPILWQEPE